MCQPLTQLTGQAADLPRQMDRDSSGVDVVRPTARRQDQSTASSQD